MVSPNGPAFPTQGQGIISPTYGLTKREWFAGLAMQGILANSDLLQTIDKKSGEACLQLPAGVANFAFQCADALIRTLTKAEENEKSQK